MLWFCCQSAAVDRDLAQLTDIEYRDNPHYPGGHPMKLYLVRELEVLHSGCILQVILMFLDVVLMIAHVCLGVALPITVTG